MNYYFCWQTCFAMDKIKEILYKDFPYLNLWQHQAMHIGITILLCAFSIFGLDAFNIRAWVYIPEWISFLGLHGFILIGLSVMLISQTIIYFLIKKYEFRIIHLCSWLILEIIFIASILTFVYGEYSSSFISEWLTILKFTSLVMVIPYMTSLLLLISVVSKDKHPIKTSFQTPADLLNFSDEKNQTRLSIKNSNILYIESTSNYITIYYTDENKVKRELVRNTLKYIENQFSSHGLLRCHRSFIINIHNIEAIKKVSRSYQIKVKYVESIIPVSKSFIPQVKELIKQV